MVEKSTFVMISQLQAMLAAIVLEVLLPNTTNSTITSDPGGVHSTSLAAISITVWLVYIPQF